jgi:transposase
MIWEDICEEHVIKLIELKKTKKMRRNKVEKKFIISTDYIEQILESILKSFYDDLKAKNVQSLYMQDNASIHESKETTLRLRQNQIITLKWSSFSSDLNSTEWMWRSCKQKIKRYSRMITNVNDMLQRLIMNEMIW